MGTVQDVDTVLEAIRLLKEDDSVFFLFAGHGNKLEALKQTVSQEGLSNARVLDYLHGKDYQQALDVCSAALISIAPGTTGLCVPSKTYSYMMEGIPLIVIMDDSDIVADTRKGAGVSLKNGQSQLLVQKLRAMQADPEAQARMRSVCRRLYLENYTPEICTRKYVSLFQDLLGGEAEP